MDKNEEIIKQLKKWVKENYKQQDTGNAFMISPAGYVKSFLEGRDYGKSMAAYEIGCILNMDQELKEPFSPNKIFEGI